MTQNDNGKAFKCIILQIISESALHSICLQMHFPNPANRNKWSARRDLIEMCNCIVIQTLFHANGLPHIYHFPVNLHWQTYTIHEYCTHTHTNIQTEWTDRHEETQTQKLTHQLWCWNMPHVQSNVVCTRRWTDDWLTGTHTHIHTHTEHPKASPHLG